MRDIQSDNRYRERLVVLVPYEFKERIVTAAANSLTDEGKVSNLVRRAVDRLIEEERLLESEPAGTQERVA